MSTPAIQTARLLLRAFTRADALDVFAYASNPNVSRYTTWQTHRTAADSEAFIEMVLARGPGSHTWAITQLYEPPVIGAIEFGLHGNAEAQFHYVLAEPFWNRGVMTEAARAVLLWGLSRYPAVQRVVTRAMTENVGSHRVMEKCGLRFEQTRLYRWNKSNDPVEQREYACARDKVIRA
jgi:[ribosomal protein S5]-alanine N-acetyltransferase